MRFDGLTDIGNLIQGTPVHLPGLTRDAMLPIFGPINAGSTVRWTVPEEKVQVERLRFNIAIPGSGSSLTFRIKRNGNNVKDVSLAGGVTGQVFDLVEDALELDKDGVLEVTCLSTNNIRPQHLSLQIDYKLI